MSLGVASLQALAIGFVCVPLGLAMCGGLIAFVIWTEGADLGDAGGYAAAAALAVLGYGATKLNRAWKYRPSDIEFREEHIKVAGGHNDGLEIPWDGIRGGVCEVAEKTDEKGKDTRWILRVKAYDVAEADDPLEGDSFREVVQAIRSRVAPEKEEKVSKKIDVVTCANCGAFVAPADSGETKCTHCDAEVQMPKDIRERVRATSQLTKQSRRVEKLVGKVLDQPGAGSTTALLWLSFAIIGGAWPFSIWAFFHLYRLDELSPLRVIALILLPFILIADGFFLSRLRMVDRRALGTLATTFAAKPPAKEGDPPRCRSCLGPLPDQSTVVVQCVYCKTSNITGIDLRGNVKRAKKSARSLEEALKDRTVERRAWQLRTLGSIPLFALAAWVIYDVIRP